MKRLDPELRPLLWRQLAGLLGSGLPLSDALLALGRDSDSAQVRELTDAARGAVDDGSTLSSALERSGAFDDATVACLSAAEESGRLVEACRLLADHEERSRGLRLRARMVLAYPVVLWIAGIAIASSLVAVADWSVDTLTGGLGVRSPLAYSALTTGAIALNVLAVLIGIAALAATYAWRVPRHADWRRRLERVVLRLPVWSRYWRAVVMGRFLRGLGTLLDAGVPFDRSLEMAGRAAGSRLLADDVARAASAVRDGSTAAAALGSEPVLSPAALWTLRSAEERGDLIESVHELAGIYDDTAEIGGVTALTVLEPTAIAVAGSLAALLVLATALPLFNLYALVP